MSSSLSRKSNSLFLTLFLFLSTLLYANADESVSIQLKWSHSFQFAGYYAAIAKGFYADEGLDVTLKEIDLERDLVKSVVEDGDSEYGVSDSSLVVSRLSGVPVVLVAQVFQHSPLVFISHRGSNITTPYEMVGKRVMYPLSSSDSSLQALILKTIGDFDKIDIREFTSYEDFVDKKVDVISAYSTAQPYRLKKRGIDINIIDPKSYGIDFYGDNLFTSEKELKEHPHRVEKMRRATLKGWQYALSHQEEIIDLIIRAYAPDQYRDALDYEARGTYQMVMPDLNELGQLNEQKYAQVAKTYFQLGIVDKYEIDTGFFYKNRSKKILLTQKEKEYIKAHKTIRVGGEYDWAPFDFLDDSGTYRGVAKDVLDLLSEKTGLVFDVVTDRWSKNLQKMREGSIDLLPALYHTDSRAKYMSFTRPYFELLDYFFIRDDLDVKTMADLDGKRVALPRGFAHEETLGKEFPGLEIVSVDDLSQAVDAVLEGKADVLFDTYSALAYKLKKESISGIVPFRSYRGEHSVRLHMATAKDDPVLASILDKGLALITPDERDRVYRRWIGTSRPSPMDIGLDDKESAWIASHPSVTLGADDSWPPFDFVDRHGVHRGVAADILALIKARTGLEIDVKAAAWPEIMKQVKAGEIDGLTCAIETPERKRYLRFTHPYMDAEIGIFVRDDREDIDDVGDLSGKRVAVGRESYIHEWLSKQHPDIPLYLVDTDKEAIEAVLYERADAFIGNVAVASYMMQKKLTKTLKVVDNIDGNELSIGFAIRKDNDLLYSILQKALDSISYNERQKIIRRWYQDSSVVAIDLNEEESRWLKENPTITFTGDPNWLPFEAFDRDDRYVGIVADYLKELEQILPISFVPIRVQTWLETLGLAKKGEIDVISDVMGSPGMVENYVPITPYLKTPIVIAMRNEHGFVNDIEDISDKRIAMIEGYGYVESVRKAYPEQDFQLVENADIALESLASGKIDAAVLSMPKAGYLIRTKGYSNLKIVGKTSVEMELTLFVNKSRPLLHAILDRTMRSLSRKTSSDILKGWLEVEFAKKTDYTLLLELAAVFVFFLLGTLYWNRRLSLEIGRRKESETQMRTLLDNIPLHIVVSRHDGKLLLANPQTIQDHRLEGRDLSKLDVSTFYADRKERDAIMHEVRSQGSVTQRIVRFAQPDGIHSMMLSVLPIRYARKEALLSIGVDLIERLEMEQALIEAKERADAANRSKSEFLANMSHEIRTPMNSIIGFTELLDEQLSEPRLRSYVKTIHNASYSLLTLINDILDLSKIEAGKLRIEKRPTDLFRLSDEIGAIFMMSVRNKGLDLIVDVDPDLPDSLLIDQVRLRQVLVNLIGNAVKFTDHGYIRLSIHASQRDTSQERLDLEISIVDTGIGIPADQLKRIFEEFEQKEGQDDRRFGGSGLGLSISKRLTEMMNGRLTVQSVQGKGSTFNVQIFDVERSSALPDPGNKDEVSMDARSIVFRKAKVMVVDDIEDNRELIIRDFDDTKITVVTASDGLEAIEQYKREKPDLILMDIKMPRMDGYEAASAIKSMADVPIIALTASVMKDEYERLSRKDFDDHLKKPIIREDLFLKVSEYLAYDKAEGPKPEETEEKLSEKAQNNLGVILQTIEREVVPIHDKAMKSNSFTDIKQLASAMQRLASQYEVGPLERYAEGLFEAIDAFDIAKTERLLHDFDKVYAQLTL
jgi:two-component system sensor histidine kinase EvgS